MTGRKGEVNIEFVVFMGIMLIILGVVSIAALNASQGVSADNEVSDARKITYQIASEINFAAEIGDGYRHQFDLPNFIYTGKNYSIAFDEPGFVAVHWSDRQYSLPILAGQVSGTITNGTNVISNVNGVITFG